MPLTTCPDCGQQVSTRAATCPHCGAPNDEKSQVPTASRQPSPEATRQAALAPESDESSPYDETTGRLNLWSMITGIVAMFAYQIILIPIAAAVLGIVALNRNDPGRLTGKWRAWIGTILGSVYTLLALFWLSNANGTF